MRLVKNPKRVLKHFSTWALTIGGGLQGIWLGMPETLRSELPPSAGQYVAWVTLVVALWGLGGKVIDQGAKDGNPS